MNDNVYDALNNKIWSDPNTAEELGYDTVDYPLQTLISSTKIDQEFKKYILEISKQKEKISVIDIGGGNGRKYHFLKKEIFKNIPFSYTVVDINSTCIKTGREYFKVNKNVKFIEKNIAEFKPSMKYDICIMDSTLCYLPQPYDIIKMIYDSCNSLLLLRTQMALPTHPAYYLNQEITGYGYQDNLTNEDNEKSLNFLRVTAEWAGKKGVTNLFPPALWGILFSHPRTKSLSYGIKPVGPDLHGSLEMTRKEYRPHWRDKFTKYLNLVIQEINTVLASPKSENFLEDHRSEYVGRFECEFFVEIHQ